MSTEPRALREVRASFTSQTIRVYQAFSVEIAGPALAAKRFVPPFRRERMTWIKPSFTWMMYRSGWGEKQGQERLLAIDLTREGFEWALAHSALSHFCSSMHASAAEWHRALRAAPVRIQWDPERTVALEPLPWRTIQIGLAGEAVNAYVEKWIVNIENVTMLAGELRQLVERREFAAAENLRPLERPYLLSEDLARHIGSIPP